MNIGSGQFVYMAMNQDRPYLVKIGHTQNPIDRERTLFSAGEPEPYHMLHIWEVHDMLYVEEGVIHPWLDVARNFYGKEIFHLDHIYPNMVDPEIWDTVNGLNLANQLAQDIDAYLTQRNIAYRKVWIYEAEQLDATIREGKKLPKGGHY